MNNRTLNDSAYAELVSLYQGKEINRVLEKVELHLEDRILDPRLFTLKGICEQQRGNLKGAAEAFSQAINLAPDHTDALINLGLVKKLLGDTESAIALYKKALSVNPRERHALNNLGNLYLHVNNPSAGLAVLKKGVFLYPESADLLSNLGLAYKLLNDFEQAAEYLAKAIERGATKSNVLLNLGVVLEQLGRDVEAIKLYEQIPIEDSLGQMALARRATRYAAEFDFLNLRKIKTLLKDLGTGPRAVTPFSLLYFDDKPSRQFFRASNYWNSKFQTLAKEPQARPVTQEGFKIINIGYVSAEFHTHAVSQLTHRLFELHDRTKFKVIGYSLTEGNQDRLGKQIARYFDEFHSVGSRSDLEISNQIAKDSIDILIDLSGYTKLGRPGIFARKPASVQINYLGYPGTLGSNAYDYIIADAHLIKSDEEKNYSEKIIYMPICYQISNDQRPKPDRKLNRKKYGFHDEQIILSGFNNIIKFSEETVTTWFELLEEYPQTILWITTNNQTATGNIKKFSKQFRLKNDQLLFSNYCDYESYLDRLAASDIFLDTAVFNAGSTANDSLWCGLPIVTLEGRSYQSRMASSMLRSLSIESLIASNHDEYKSIAAELIENPNKIASIRSDLLEARDKNLFFDTTYFTSKVEEAYGMAYRQQAENKEAVNIRLNRD